MKKLILACLAVSVVFFACRNDPSQSGGQTDGTTAKTIDPKTVMLVCQPVEEPNMEADAPQHEVFIQLGDSKIKVADILNCETISPDQFGNYQIPDGALSAVGGWWAGAGDYLYVIHENDGFVVKQGGMDEMQEDNDFGYRTVLTFSNEGRGE